MPLSAPDTFPAVEVKRLGKQERLHFIDMINQAGGFAFVAYSVEEVEARLERGLE